RTTMTAKTALITGITGQDGSYLADWLLEKGYRVCGMVRRASTENFQRIEHIRDRIQLLQGDLLDQTSIASVLDQARPDEVYNLAAMSFVPTSWQKPVLTAEFTAVGVTRVLDALRQSCPGARFYHESPRRGLEFVTRKITHSVARIKLGLASELRLGNLQAKRDWGFAGDYVRAMWLMLQQDQAEDYVVGTGQTHSVEEFVRIAFDQVGLDWRKHVVIDPQYYRPAE